MKVSVKVKPKAKVNRVEKVSESQLNVWVTAPPVDNKANEAVRELLADHFNIAKSRVTLVRGAKSKEKIFDVTA